MQVQRRGGVWKVGIVDAVPNQPGVVFRVDDLPCGLFPIGHGRLDNRAKLKWKPALLEGEGEMPEHFTRITARWRFTHWGVPTSVAGHFPYGGSSGGP